METGLRYSLILEQDGINYVKVVENKGNQKATIIWKLALDHDDEPIIFNAFYSESKFIIVNWDGWIRIGDAESKQIILDHKLNGSVTSRAQLSIDKTKLYVAFDDSNSEPALATLNLNDLSVSLEPLPNCFHGQMEIRHDGSLLFYYHDRKRTTAGTTWTHGYTVYDPATKTTNQYAMDHAPRMPFDVTAPIVSSKHNLGIMPYWENVESIVHADGTLRFVFKILLFNLSDFKIRNILKVREFTADQLSCHESECEEMAAILQSPTDDTYDEILTQFFDNLCSIAISPYEDSCWLSWRGGIARKVTFDGVLYPLLIVASMPRSTNKGIYNYPMTYLKIHSVTSSEVMLQEDDDYYKISLSEVDLKQEYCAIDLMSISIEQLYNIHSESGDADPFEKHVGKVVVSTHDLESLTGLEQALNQLIILTANLDETRKGNQLQFLIRDEQGIEYDDRAFFRHAAKFPVDEKIKTIIQNFIQYHKADRLYINSEETALCYAVYELVNKSPIYIDTAMRYLSTIDIDHDVFNREQLLPMLAEKYNNTPHQHTIQKSLHALNEEWAEEFDYYLNH